MAAKQAVKIPMDIAADHAKPDTLVQSGEPHAVLAAAGKTGASYPQSILIRCNFRAAAGEIKDFLQFPYFK